MSSLSGGLPRPALADVTNQTRKRAIEGCGGKMSDGFEDDLQDLPVSKQVCLGLAPLIHLGSDSSNGDTGSGLMSQKTAVRTPPGVLPLEASPHGDCQDGDKVIALDDFNLDTSESSESAKSVHPSIMQSFELERCTSLKEDNDSNSAASAADMLKTCSCSFCLKGNYFMKLYHLLSRCNSVHKCARVVISHFCCVFIVSCLYMV